MIPVLFYTGKRSLYQCSTRWLDEFNYPELAERLYNGDFPLVDVTVIPDEEIMEHRSMATLVLLLTEHMTGHHLVSLVKRFEGQWNDNVL